MRRRWRAFLIVEAALLTAWGFGVWATVTSSAHSQAWATFLGILGAWLCFSLPVAVSYLFGRPPVMSLWPLRPSPQERAYRQEVGGRPVLTDEEFYARFYEGSGIPPEIPARVRRCLADIDMLIERAHPTDMIAHAYDDLDWYDVLFQVERAFGIRFAEQEYPLFTGTLGNLIDQVHDRLRRDN